jgi:membrane protein
MVLLIGKLRKILIFVAETYFLHTTFLFPYTVMASQPSLPISGAESSITAGARSDIHSKTAQAEKIRKPNRKAFNKRALKVAWQHVNRILRRADEHHIYLAASGIAFNIVLFILPTILVMVFVVGLLMDRGSILLLVESFLLDVLPPSGGLDGAIEVINKEIISILKNYEGAGWIGVPMLFWVSLTLFSSMRTGLNTAFGIVRIRTFFGSLLRDSALFFLFIAAVLTSANAALISHSIADWITTADRGQEVLTVISFIISTLVSYIFFIALYCLAPNTLPPMRVVLLSTLICSASWGLARYAFGYYLANFASYGKMYGVYGAAVALALWVYYSALTILMSAELAQYWFEDRRRRRLERQNRLRVASYGG